MTDSLVPPDAARSVRSERRPSFINHHVRQEATHQLGKCFLCMQVVICQTATNSGFSLKKNTLRFKDNLPCLSGLGPCVLPLGWEAGMEKLGHFVFVSLAQWRVGVWNLLKGVSSANAAKESEDWFMARTICFSQENLKRKDLYFKTGEQENTKLEFTSYICILKLVESRVDLISHWTTRYRDCRKSGWKRFKF